MAKNNNIYKVMSINIYTDKKGKMSASTEVHEKISQDTVIKILETLIGETKNGKLR
jgi:predicted phage tail protein